MSNHDAPGESLRRGNRLIAWFGIAFGALTVATPALALLIELHWLHPLLTLFYVLLGAGTAFAGVLILRGCSTGLWLLFALFAIQCVEFFCDAFSYSLVGPISLRFGFGRSANPFWWLKFNALAIAVCVWSTALASKSEQSLQHTSDAGPTPNA